MFGTEDNDHNDSGGDNTGTGWSGTTPLEDERVTFRWRFCSGSSDPIDYCNDYSDKFAYVNNQYGEEMGVDCSADGSLKVYLLARRELRAQTSESISMKIRVDSRETHTFKAKFRTEKTDYIKTTKGLAANALEDLMRGWQAFLSVHKGRRLHRSTFPLDGSRRALQSLQAACQ